MTLFSTVGRTLMGSVFAKCAGLIALCTAIVAGVLSFQSGRLTTNVAENGIRMLAIEVTSALAARSGGAIRFAKLEELQPFLDHAIEQSKGAGLLAVALNIEGGVVAQSGAQDEPAFAMLEALAAEAIATGTTTMSDNGFMVVVPATFGGEGTIVGAIAMSWTPDKTLREIRIATYWSVGLAVALFVALLFFSSWMLRKMIAVPLNDLGAAMADVSSGNYDRDIPVQNRTDEIGGIARALFEMTNRLKDGRRARENQEREQEAQKTVVDSLSASLNKLSDGDLTSSIGTEFDERYEALRIDFNRAVERLQGAMQAVVANSEGIRLGSDEIRASSDDLSRRTENQAATLEETAAALQELTESVQSAADGAREVEEIVGAAKSSAEESGIVVGDAVSAMSEIEKSSDQISQIIGVIDDIAFQTNLLALNAGVEAARAGDAGRGFAVVASEVRGLAQRSSDAAKEIKALIGGSSEQVARGVKLVGKAGLALEEIVERVGNISEHVTNIAASAIEQSNGLNEINVGVSQLDQVTQQNAAMVEEATAASHSLNDEAIALNNLVAQFRLSADSRTDTTLRPNQIAAE